MKSNDEINRWCDEYYFKMYACKKAMIDDYALSHAYNNHKFKDFMEQLIGTHSLEYVSHLLSNTIWKSAWDGRYSGEVKAWATHYPTIQQSPVERKESVRFSALYLNEHPVILNQAVLIAIQKKRSLPIPKERSRSDEKTRHSCSGLAEQRRKCTASH